jgi:hypothetical protein
LINIKTGKFASDKPYYGVFYGDHIVTDNGRIPVSNDNPDAIFYKDLKFVNPDIRKNASVTASRFIQRVKSGKYTFPLKKNFYDKLQVKEMFRKLEKYSAEKEERFLFTPYTLRKVKGIETCMTFFDKYDSSLINKFSFSIRCDEADYENFNILSDMFNEEVRMKCNRKNSESPWDMFHKHPELVANYITQNKLSFDNPREVRDAIWKTTNECTSFRPNILSTIIQMFQSTSVLDFSAGWGDRLIGAMASKVSYTGIDPNRALHSGDGYPAMIKEFGGDRKSSYRMIESTIENANIPPGSYDLVFTSPPYFDLELYTSGNNEYDSKTQSSRHKSEDAWFDNFLKVALRKCWDELVYSEKNMVWVGEHAQQVGNDRDIRGMENIRGEWRWDGSWKESIMAINLNQTSPKDRYVKKMIDFVTNELGGYYRGVISYRKIEADPAKENAQPIWIWQKLSPEDLALVKTFRVEDFCNVNNARVDNATSQVYSPRVSTPRHLKA